MISGLFRVRLHCDGDGCDAQIVGTGNSTKEADASLLVAVREAGWMAEALEERFAERDRRRNDGGAPIVIKRDDRCPSCLSKEAS